MPMIKYKCKHWQWVEYEQETFIDDIIYDLCSIFILILIISFEIIILKGEYDGETKWARI